jgi:NTE family protein
MTLDVLLASACLPQLFQAVEIDGEPYWDGGYSGNPALWPMIDGERVATSSRAAHADGAGRVPSDSMSIQRRIHEIVFNASLVAEMRRSPACVPLRVREESRRACASCGCIASAAAHAARGRLAARALVCVDRAAAGRRPRAVQRFLARHHGDLGVRETLDIGTMFEPRGGLESANDDPYAQAAAL